MHGIFALDLATNTGFANWSRDTNDVSGGSYRIRGGEDLGAFLADFEIWLHAQLRLNQPTVVVYEAPILRSKRQDGSGFATPVATARKLMSLAGVTEMQCHKKGVREVMPADLQSVKKHFAGHGHADKSQMIAAAHKRGWDAPNHDCADAFGLLDFAMSKYVPHVWRKLAGRQGLLTDAA